MSTLKDLHKKYKGCDLDKLNAIYYKYIKRKQDSLIDSITAASAIGSIFMADKIDYSKVTPKIEEAFNISFPDKNIEEIEQLNSEELTGILSNWKGKLFEIEVRDKLNSGELVGDIQLESGQYAEIAGNLNQPGWDLEIFNADGTVAEALQLKATNSLSYINEAFEKYPDIGIMSTSEISELNDDLINSNISLEDLEADLYKPMEPLMDGFGEDVLDTILPGLPFLIISLGEGRKAFIGQQTANKAIEKAMERSVKTGFSMGVGGFVGMVTNSWWLAPAASFLTRQLFNYFENEEQSEKLAQIISGENKKLMEFSNIYLR